MWRVAVPALFSAACSSNSPTDAAGVVQVTTIKAGTTTVSCAFGLASPDSIYFNVTLVNTTKDSVTVQSVASTGTIIRSDSDQGVQAPANTYANLPFHPPQSILRPRDGQVVITVSMPMTPLCSGSGAGSRRDVLTTLRVTTSAGI